MSENNSALIDDKKRRIRRSAVDIARHYKCTTEGCAKSYGSEGSLNQHIKIKHPQLYKGIEPSYDQNEVVKEYQN